MMSAIREDLAALNVKHDVFFSERSLIEGRKATSWRARSANLREQGEVYKGRLPPPKGVSERGLGRSRADSVSLDRFRRRCRSAFEQIRWKLHVLSPPISPITRTSSIAAFRSMIDVWGADHARLHQAHAGGGEGASAAAMPSSTSRSSNWSGFCAAASPYEMSKRAGEFVTLREVVDEVGRDAVRFMMLYRKNDAVALISTSPR